METHRRARFQCLGRQSWWRLSHHATSGVADGVGGGRWVVRYCGNASRPMRLPKAKPYAIEMVKGIRPGKVITDPIRLKVCRTHAQPRGDLGHRDFGLPAVDDAANSLGH